MPLPLTLASKGKARSQPQKRTRAPESFPIGGDLARWTVGVLRRDVIAQERDQFLDYHRAHGSLFLDWNAAWRTWARNAVKWRPEIAAPKAKDASLYGDGSGNNGLFALIEENRARATSPAFREPSYARMGTPNPTGVLKCQTEVASVPRVP